MYRTGLIVPSDVRGRRPGSGRRLSWIPSPRGPSEQIVGMVHGRSIPGVLGYHRLPKRSSRPDRSLKKEAPRSHSIGDGSVDRSEWSPIGEGLRQSRRRRGEMAWARHCDGSWAAGSERASHGGRTQSVALEHPGLRVTWLDFLASVPKPPRQDTNRMLLGTVPRTSLSCCDVASCRSQRKKHKNTNDIIHLKGGVLTWRDL